MREASSNFQRNPPSPPGFTVRISSFSFASWLAVHVAPPSSSFPFSSPIKCTHTTPPPSLSPLQPFRNKSPPLSQLNMKRVPVGSARRELGRVVEYDQEGKL